MRNFWFLALIVQSTVGYSQAVIPRNVLANEPLIQVNIQAVDGTPVQAASVELRLLPDSSLVAAAITDTTGHASFRSIKPATYFLVVSSVNFDAYSGPAFKLEEGNHLMSLPPILLQRSVDMMNNVTITGRKPFIQLMADKTIVNVEAGLTNAGATVLEVLEKSPGVTLDKDGNISLKGKQQVLILVDGKQTYLSSAEIAQMLGSMNASQVELIELMDNPPSSYDAAGNGGVINIRMKKLRQKGFNGNVSTSYGQGFYYKNNNSASFNYRRNNLNVFGSYSAVFNKGFTDLYALRSYFDPNTVKVNARLTQDTWLTGAIANHTARAGVDYSITSNTSIGLLATGMKVERRGTGAASGLWTSPSGEQDSLIDTYSRTGNQFQNGGGNINFKHLFRNKQELTVDLDYLKYSINSRQYFDNIVRFPNAYTESIRGTLPASIRILSAKADYRQELGKAIKAETGWKLSNVKTDNLAAYEVFSDSSWQTDVGKSNRFLYDENIAAAYVSASTSLQRFSIQGGLRFEHTSYTTLQKATVQSRDSAFERKYSGLFPTLFIQYRIDSGNSLSFSAGRRIDRPAYQRLNPFVFVINKYTYEKGNPLFLPQYTWNLQLTHDFRQKIITTLNYSITRNYFSQIFLSEPSGLLIYTQGNLGRMQNIGISVSAQHDLTSWWGLSLQTNLYNKSIKGVVARELETSLTQLSLNMNNQFMLGKGWSAELSGFFVTKDQELQEITDPTGQLIAGVGKQVLKKKGNLRLTLRDIFYTQAMKGDTNFDGAFEYFKLTRDTRVLTIAFTYRFGKAFKSSNRNTGATEEMERANAQ